MSESKTKKEPVQTPELDMEVYHEKIYHGKKLMKIVGIRKNQVELEGDWMPLEGTFRLRKICEQKNENGVCPNHNLYCAYPNCEPYI